MKYLEKIFEDKALTFAEFEKALAANESIKLINLKDGGYVDKDKLDTKIIELNTANQKIIDYETKLGDLEQYKGSTEGLQKELTDLKTTIANEKAEAERLAKEQVYESEMQGRFNGLVGDNKWRDELTSEAVYRAFKKAISDETNKGKGDKEVFESLIKDKNYYENPNKPQDMQGFGNVDSDVATNDVLRAAMGLPVGK